MPPIIPYDGRKAFAARVQEGTLHLAWGRGNPNWDSDKDDDLTFDGDNLLLNSDGRYGVNRVVNGDFPTNADGWSGGNGGTGSSSGGAGVVTNTAVNGYIQQRIALSSQRRYRCSGQFSVGTVGDTARVSIVDSEGATVAGQVTGAVNPASFSFFFESPLNGDVFLRLTLETTVASREATFDNITLVDAGYMPVSGVSVQSQDRSTNYVEGVDYRLAMDEGAGVAIGTLVRIPEGSIVQNQTVRVRFTVDTPSGDFYARGLLDEVGRRRVTTHSFVEPDPAGTVTVSQGTFRLVAYPTRYLFVETVFDFVDAVGETLRESGLFSGGTEVGGLPGGQRYFTPDEVDDPGLLVMLENSPAFDRSAAARETYRTVISF